MLTDGEPQADQSADSKVEGLRGKACDGTREGRCLDDMAEYLVNADLSTTLNGQQSVLTYAVGFGNDVPDWSFLEDAARSGGGRRS